MSGLSVSMAVSITPTFVKAVQGVNSTYKPQVSFSDDTTDGVAIDSADVVWCFIGKTIAGSGTLSLDLSGGLTDAFGDAATFAKVKCVYIANKNTTAGDSVKIGGDSNAFLLFDAANDVYELGPGGVFLVWEPCLAGLPVTAGTGDILKIVNQSSNTVTLDIVITGTSS